MNGNPQSFEPDIVARIRRDFGSDAEAVLQELESSCSEKAELRSSRLIRCIVFAAGGRRDAIARYIQMARDDFRDLIMSAEYQRRPGTKRSDGVFDHLRDFNQPFQD